MATKEVPGLNDRALQLADDITRNSAELGIRRGNSAGARMLDAGIESLGSIRAGAIIAQTAMANLGTVSVVPNPDPKAMGPAIAVNVTHPVAACVVCQHDGWLIEDESSDFKARGSGPFRAAYGKEDFYEIFGFRERTGGAVGIIESLVIPPRDLTFKLAVMCGVQQHHLALICVNPDSLAGSVLTASRTVQWALIKLHMLNFNIKQIVAGYGLCPLAPVGGSVAQSIGMAYDQIIYNSQVMLYARGDDKELASVVTQLPSSTSPMFGQKAVSLLQLEESGPPYQLDPSLLAPARVCIQNLDTGKCHDALG